MDLFDQKELDKIDLLYLSLKHDNYLLSKKLITNISPTLDKSITIKESKKNDYHFDVYFEKGTKGFFKKPYYIVHLRYWKKKAYFVYILGDDEEPTKFDKFPEVRRPIVQFIKTMFNSKSFTKEPKHEELYEASGFKLWTL